MLCMQAKQISFHACWQQLDSKGILVTVMSEGAYYVHVQIAKRASMLLLCMCCRPDNAPCI
jgi:hypothetical protein